VTKQLEILDALPGCGKTTAILKYISEHQDKPWLYLSPMRTEINERVPADADALGLNFFIAVERSEHSDYKTMTLQVLEALKEKKSIACTHNLMLRFTQEHIDLIKLHGYNVVCDEELDLIKGYNQLKKGDIDFLLENKHIEISDTDGKITFLTEISTDSRYGDVKLFADAGCLYSAKTRNDFLVIQISPRLVHNSNRFILLTYNYNGSVMDTFMKMHGFTSVSISDIPLLKSTQERTKEIRDLISFIETPSVKRWQKRKSCLSATWWKNITSEDIEVLTKDVSNIMKSSKVSSDELMITFPKGNLTGYDSETNTRTSKKFKLSRIDTNLSYVAYNARATNAYKHKTTAIHLTNLHPMQPVLVYMQDQGFVCDSDSYALSTFIQWLFRGCIREGKPMKVAIFSERMSTLFKMWLSRIDVTA
jgi:hypothetical protein